MISVTRPKRRRHVFLMGVLLAPMSGAADAGAARQCTALVDPMLRLACYDRLHDRKVPPAAGHASAGSSPEQTGAVSDAGADKAVAGTSTAPTQNGDDITDGVVATGHSVTGRQWFRLQNGQLWEQVSAERVTIEAGAQVRISRGAFGTHQLRLADGASRETRVRRLE